MAENVCFAILRTTTLQILQSAGFESAHLEPTDVLTDVFCQYIQLLSSTVSAYAGHSGRSAGSAWDVMDALKDLALNADVLSAWLEEDGKALLPSWSAQSDPSLVLQDTVTGGRSKEEEALVYEYTSLSNEELDAAINGPWEEEDEEEEKVEREETTFNNIPEQSRCDELLNRLPDYIPNYFPPIPVEPKDEMDAEETHSQPPTQSPIPPTCISSSIQTNTLPPPVKSRKKPIDNPFTHIIPFEESALATTSVMSLTLSSNDDLRKEQPIGNKRRRVAPNHQTVSQIIDELDRCPPSQVVVRESLAGVQRVFRQVTEDDASPGNTMYGYRAGMLDEVVRYTTLPIALSNLSSPNMLVDMVSWNSQGGTISAASPLASPSPSASSAGLPEPSEPVKSTNVSMLAALAAPGGRHSTPNGSTNLSSQQPSTPVPLSKTPTPPPSSISKTTLAPISLASLSSQSNLAKRKKNQKLAITITGTGAMPTSVHASQGPLSTPVSASTTKFRLTVKDPEKELVEVKTEPMLPLPSSNILDKSNEKEVINCFCEHPTIDYGTFMIACDKCNVWFHGSCVRIGESDQIEEWQCKRCAS